MRDNKCSPVSQQFLATCIGTTEEENDQLTDAQHGDEPQTELDDNSSDDAEVNASSATDTEVSEHTETEENDVPSAPEEIHPEKDAPLIAADAGDQTHPDSDPVPIDENTGANEDNVPTESSVGDLPADEVIDFAPVDGNDTIQFDVVPEDETKTSSGDCIVYRGKRGKLTGYRDRNARTRKEPRYRNTIRSTRTYTHRPRHY